jgi:flagella basal body P-ring formation protein FlgA
MTERRGAPPPAAAPVDPAPTASVRGFRPGSRRRARIAAGVALAAVAIGGNALVYATLDDRVEVVQVVRDIPAGDTIEATDLRVVGADVDETVPVVHADAIDTVIGSYARTAIGDG